MLRSIFSSAPLIHSPFSKTLRDSMLCTAMGDALGAGVEKWRLSQIQQYFGSASQVACVRFKRDNMEPTRGDAGDVTDDTAMTVCVAAALTKTLKQFSRGETSKFTLDAFMDHAIFNMHQAFLYWAQYQVTYSGKSGRDCRSYIVDGQWPDINPFLNTHGAGDGTINVLSNGRFGTLTHLPKKVTTSGNPYVSGCGALMRVMPIGLFATEIPGLDAFELGCRSGVITHGDASAYLAAGIAADIIADVHTKEISFEMALKLQLTKLKGRLKSTLNLNVIDGLHECINAISIADRYANTNSYPMDILDRVGTNCDEKLFSTMPVFAQALFVALAAERHHWTADHALQMAVIQSGDSDSTAAIAGGFLGVMGPKRSRISDEMLATLNPAHRAGVLQASNNLAVALTDFNQVKLTRRLG